MRIRPEACFKLLSDRNNHEDILNRSHNGFLTEYQNHLHDEGIARERNQAKAATTCLRPLSIGWSPRIRIACQWYIPDDGCGWIIAWTRRTMYAYSFELRWLRA